MLTRCPNCGNLFEAKVVLTCESFDSCNNEAIFEGYRHEGQMIRRRHVCFDHFREIGSPLAENETRDAYFTFENPQDFNRFIDRMIHYDATSFFMTEKPLQLCIENVDDVELPWGGGKSSIVPNSLFFRKRPREEEDDEDDLNED